ncbi:MAG: hypothetical protein IAE82_15005 [Opitutaceae bacterium]|nr:hypothetical protein [Opitutaceae bacterium]
MIREWIRTLRAQCPPWARQLDLVYEHAAIAARHRRMRTAWQPHLARSREIVLEGAGRCTSFGRALVIGAGDCLDVPVDDLAARFGEVVLADIVVSPVARALARRHPGRVRCVSWDATGALEKLAAVRATVVSAGARRIFEEADPGPPPGGEPDLVVSANCLSQLGLVPGHALPAARVDDALPDRCGTTAAKQHLAWLGQRVGAVRVLLADTARLDLGPDGREIKRENLLARLPLRRPDHAWRWNLAPIPEYSPDIARIHEVGAWIDVPAA